MKLKKVFCIVAAFMLCVCTLSACTDEAKETSGAEDNNGATGETEFTDAVNTDSTSSSSTQGKTYVKTKEDYRYTNVTKVKFELENGGKFVMELYPQYAPETVENFCTLVEDGFYDGIIFHRVIPGFMAQGGDPTGTGTGGSDATITGEFSNNGFKNNTLKHERGTVSMARTLEPNSASSQFFICFEAAPHLDGDYAAFGKVIEGMEVVDSIGEVATDSMDKPLEDVVIKSAKIIK